MRQRWVEAPFDKVMARPPHNRAHWQEYLDRYFASGLLLMAALDDSARTIRDDVPLVVSDGVRVTRQDSTTADFVIWDLSNDRPIMLTGISELQWLAAGVLAAGTDKGIFVRLDAHVTATEARWVGSLNRTAPKGT